MSEIPKSSERTAREWREVGSAIDDQVRQHIDVAKEGYAKLPLPALDALYAASAALDEFDRSMAKIDGAAGGAGGCYWLEWHVRRDPRSVSDNPKDQT